MRRWCRLVARAVDGTSCEERDLTGRGTPGIAVVDVVARAALRAARAGNRLLVADAVEAVVELLELAGLAGVVEVQRQPEGGEQPVGVEDVQEERHLGDPAT